ncbi:hypothetical protein Ahy_A02g009832 isoform A [Arachis hypogaea]|uniref:NB-ARC domain-containing protein n=1 Tax=Arachis hypogaea TaxID=3818 RepID=A0A445EIH3_ARAHY|nr:hypothetical protein Ahy_A02g009832 isoform A [Arachis hypogaea]
MCSLVSEAIAKHEKRYKDDMNNKVDKWKEALHQILLMSFDALEKEEQNVFLDITCCFKGYTLMKVTDILQTH